MLGLGISKRQAKSAGDSGLSAFETASIMHIARVTAEPVSLEGVVIASTWHGKQHTLADARRRPALGDGLALGVKPHSIWTIGV